MTPRRTGGATSQPSARQLVADSGVAPGDIRAVACSAIGPCMLPVDAAGKPLMNAVLYGVDTRAAAEVEELTARIGRDRLIARTGNPLTSQSVGPKILWLRRNRPEVWAKTARILTATSYLVFRLTGETVIDHYSAAGLRAALRYRRAGLDGGARAGHRRRRYAAAARLVGRDRRAVSPSGRRTRPGWRRVRR